MRKPDVTELAIGHAEMAHNVRIANTENATLRARVAELEAGMLDLANRVMPKMRARVAELEEGLRKIANGQAGDVPSRFARAVLAQAPDNAGKG